nr:hypothetical protein HK105_003556 [Polyrhizophydium stewartii]
MDPAPGPVPSAADAPDPRHPAPDAAPPCTVLLPRGASHWDRLPAELHDKVLEATTPLLTWLGRRRLVRAELRSMAPEQLQQVWREVFETDWQGDLSALPRLSSQGRCFLSIASRRMLDRVRAAGVTIDPALLQRLAVRRGWADLFDFGDPELLVEEAIRAGNIALVANLVDERKIVKLNELKAAFAASAGQLEMLKWLHARMGGVGWTTFVMDIACGGGNLGVVVWLHESIPVGCTAGAMDNAAASGHLHVIEWLAEKYPHNCGVGAFFSACRGGHADVLEFLRVRFPEVYEQTPDNYLDMASDFETIRWLRQHRPHLIKPSLISHLSFMAKYDAIPWVAEVTGAVLEPKHLHRALEYDQPEIVEWMVEQKGLQITEDMFANGMHGSNTHALAWVIKHDRRWAGIMADKFAEEVHEPLIQWLHVRHPGSITQRTLEAAARSGDTSIVEYLLDQVGGVAWDLGPARQQAIQAGARSVAALLDSRLGAAA